MNGSSSSTTLLFISFAVVEKKPGSHPGKEEGSFSVRSAKTDKLYLPFCVVAPQVCICSSVGSGCG